MSDFDTYWDTRIAHHQKLFDEKPRLANLLYDEALLAYEQCEKENSSYYAQNYDTELGALLDRLNQLEVQIPLITTIVKRLKEGTPSLKSKVDTDEFII